MDRQEEEIATVLSTSPMRGFEDADPVGVTVSLVWEKGYSETTVREIEAATGLDSAEIQTRYGGSRQLLERALERYGEMIERQLLGPLECAESGLPALQQFFCALQDWVTRTGRRGCMLINMLAETGSQSEPICSHARKAGSRLEAAFRFALEKADANGELTKGSVEQRARVLVGLVFGLNIAARGGATDGELQRMFDSVRMQLRLWRVS